MRTRHARSLSLAAMLLALLSSSAVADIAPSASMTTAVIGWEHWFRLDWVAQPKAKGEQIEGYIYSNYGKATVNLRVLAQGLDAQGNVVTQKIAWVPGEIPPLGRAYFIVSGLAPAERYRVTVWDFEPRKR